ncbi:antigen 5 like allergen Cul n 1-like [Teleopsis dalmanni]|uniref:antigen 5 like allergen Cul n 1-like n=1 Tax=Teleopsis dalmanni TaxID=139649 RepID=UPI0018CF1FCD|nr:antigen 5 like allergen Cul n 1-like [Teleopsis dalmanni]XP_037954538.1 antigen 5 like allergen Cul n 1-like [Teleopsis dalmanni]
MSYKMYFKVLSLIFIYANVTKFSVLSASTKLSWCDPELCPNGGTNIACNNDGNFNERCPPDTTMLDLRPYRSFILHEHNKRRNFIAAGLLPGYYPASRMATMIWDDELAYLAALNLKACYVDHDPCHNSYRFRNVGQNLSGVDRQHDLPTNITDLLLQSMGLWFGEYPLIDSSYISKFRVASNFEEYGHFVETVIDRNTHVGCAMVRYTHAEYPFLYIYNTACNYGSVYAVGAEVYRVGEPASECETGSNPFYPSLCSIEEKMNPNYS